MFDQVYGEAGITKLLHILQNELVEGMQMIGAHTLNSIHKTTVSSRLLFVSYDNSFLQRLIFPKLEKNFQNCEIVTILLYK